MKYFYDMHGNRCKIVNEFIDEGIEMVVYRSYIPHKKYWKHDVNFKSVINDGIKNNYFFKSKYLYNKNRQ